MNPSATFLGLSSDDPRFLAAELFRWSERLVGTEGAAIHLVTERGLEPRWLTETRPNTEVVPVDCEDPGPIGRAARDGVIQIVSESRPGVAPLGGFWWRSAVCIPLRVEGRVVGVFSAGWRAPVPVTDDVCLVLEAAASLTASALHRAGLLEDVRREQYRLREALEWLPVVATIVDQETLTIRWANTKARRMLGDIQGTSAHDVLAGGELEEYHDGTIPTWEGVRHAVSGDIPLGRVSVRTKDGTRRVLETTIAPLDGGISLILQMDVTRDAHIEQERDRFVHMLSHHLRTPLTPVLGFVDLIADSSLDEPTREEAVSTIRASVSRIEHVVSRLEQIASLRPVEQGAMTPVPAIELVHRAVARVPSLAATMLDIRGDVQVVTHCAHSHVVLALQELLHNAVVHGAPPVTVTIREGSYAEIYVTDAGQGIPPEWERAVFTPFLNAATGYLAPSPDSLGLGLNLARALILATAGDLAYSDGSFTITLRTPAAALIDAPGSIG